MEWPALLQPWLLRAIYLDRCRAVSDALKLCHPLTFPIKQNQKELHAKTASHTQTMTRKPIGLAQETEMDYLFTTPPQ